MMSKIPLLICLLLIIASCSTSRFVRPLEKGQTATGFDLGGPVIDFADTKIPVPLSSLYIGHGLSNKLTVFGGLHTTALLFGTAQTDVGFTYALWKPGGKGFGLSLSPAANLMLGTRRRYFQDFSVPKCPSVVAIQKRKL